MMTMIAAPRIRAVTNTKVLVFLTVCFLLMINTEFANAHPVLVQQVQAPTAVWIDPKGTYLPDTLPEDNPNAPTTVSLQSLGYSAGDTIGFILNGSWATDSESGLLYEGVGAVFTSSDGTFLNPVGGFYFDFDSNLPEIAQDFDIRPGKPNTVVVPTGAASIKFTTWTAHYGNALDSDKDLKVTIYNADKLTQITVYSVQGSVTTELAGQKFPAKLGAYFPYETVITTADKSSVKIDIGEGQSSVVLGPNSRIHLSNSNTAIEKASVFNVLAGDVRAVVHKKLNTIGKTQLYIKIRNIAGIGVRGTELELSIEGLKTAVTVSSGIVDIYDNFSEEAIKTLGAGEHYTINTFGVAPSIIPALLL